MAISLRALSLLLLALFLAPIPLAAEHDWTDWRGPRRDGVSLETGLPARWSPAGENLVWKAPYGGRSTPIILGDRLYLQNGAGQGERLQERVMCFNADTGKLLWEHRFNVYLSDVPPHRVGWASPVADRASGHVYAFGVGGTLLALTSAGAVLWERSLAEDFGLVTTHGGRTVSPVIEDRLVIVSGVTTGWGEQARAAHRFLAFDKMTGETVWVSSPGGRPFDTTYSPPIAADVNGTRLLIAGGSDGSVHALKPQTGEPVWKYTISKRGLNTGVVLKGTTAIVTHSEENLDGSDMGLIAAVDAAAKGDLGRDQIKWAVKGFQGGFSSPVIDDQRIYQVDNGSNLFAFDLATGRQLWTLNLGTIQKASLVLADGKLYVGTENGKFFILKPGATGCEILDQDWLGSEAAPEAIIASVAISQGRVYVASSDALYCFGRKSRSSTQRPPDEQEPVAMDTSAPTHVQVVPSELVLAPGQRVRVRARVFDGRGRLIGEQPAAWALDGLTGSVSPAGEFTAGSEAVAQAGRITATVTPSLMGASAAPSISGVARVRVIPPLPWSDTFDALAPASVPGHWVNATGKFVVREVDGNKVVVKLADNPFTKRARAFLGPSDWSNYTIEVDVRAIERRRQLGDAGIVAQRYSLVLSGNHQRLELQSWQPETARTKAVPFPWKGETWYRLKLRVDTRADKTVVARGKAWPAAEPEPAGWSVERLDPIPNRQGSPGLYADALFEIYFDNLKVTSHAQ